MVVEKRASVGSGVGLVWRGEEESPPPEHLNLSVPAAAFGLCGIIIDIYKTVRKL